MPVHREGSGWQWGSHGKTYKTRVGAEKQAAAAHANGWKGDMAPGKLMGLVGALLEFFGEEAEEPEHAEDDAKQSEISRKIVEEIRKGHSPKQSAAIAYSELGKDMRPADWEGFISGLLKFFSEEADEPKHAADNGEFREEDHPRQDNGEFRTGGASSGSGHQATKIIDGKRVANNGSSLPTHIEALKIPPAWTDVTYSADPKANLLATGKDKKGRRQAIYSDTFSAKQAAAKFARINELNEKFDYISDQNEAARKSDSQKKASAADCTKLIMTTGIRPGSEDDTGAEKKAYGATTLEGRHVVVDGDAVSLQFVGKKGVSLNIPISDSETARMLRARKEAAGDDGQLFSINEKALLDHVHSLDGGGFKTKDFRTLLGTRTAMSAVEKLSPPKDMASYKKAVMAVAKTVSKKLGNTPIIALQSYINPSVFAEWRMRITA